MVLTYPLNIWKLKPIKFTFSEMGTGLEFTTIQKREELIFIVRWLLIYINNSNEKLIIESIGRYRQFRKSLWFRFWLWTVRQY